MRRLIDIDRGINRRIDFLQGHCSERQRNTRATCVCPGGMTEAGIAMTAFRDLAMRQLYASDAFQKSVKYAMMTGSVAPLRRTGAPDRFKTVSNRTSDRRVDGSLHKTNNDGKIVVHQRTHHVSAAKN